MKFIIGLFLILGTQASYAQYDLAGRWGLGLGAGVPYVNSPDTFTKDTYKLDGKFYGSVWARYHMTSRFGLELAYSNLSFKAHDSALDLSPKIDTLDLSFAYRMLPMDRLHILLQAGVGYAKISGLKDLIRTDGKASNDVMMKGRVGVEYMATSNLMVALHGDYTYVNLGSGENSRINIISPMLGVTYYFGQGGTATSAAVDSDGDGVTDANDKCAGTHAGTNVGADGCPLKADADNDGVADADDKCSGTPAGQPVNEFGCAKTEKLEFTLNVQFKPGSSVLDPKSTEDLGKFAEFMTAHPTVKAEIEGHTDNTGAEKQNFAISQKRANAVMNYLVKTKKIDKTRLTAKGYGPSQPVGDNTTAEGRTQNRRVVAHVQTEK